MPTQTQTPNFFPFTRYADANGAIEWLTQAFGFNERVAYRGDEGKVHHAEMHLGPGIFMLGEGDPAEQGVYVAVDDVDAPLCAGQGRGRRNRARDRGHTVRLPRIHGARPRRALVELRGLPS